MNTENQMKIENLQAEIKASREWNLKVTDELAEFISDGIYPMDIWEFVINTLETMAERNQVGFNDYDYVKAVVPILLERCEDNREGIICMLEAVKCQHAFRAGLQTKQKENEKKTDSDAPKVPFESQTLDVISKQVSDLLNNPNVPTPIYNALGDAINDTYNELSDQSEFEQNSNSAEYVKKVLRNYLEQNESE